MADDYNVDASSFSAANEREIKCKGEEYRGGRNARRWRKKKKSKERRKEDFPAVESENIPRETTDLFGGI